MIKPIIECKKIVKRFYIGQPNELEILHGIDLTVNMGEFVSIVGESGSGKSTLMNILGALDRPTEGTYFLDGVDVGAGKDKQLSEIRNRADWICLSDLQSDRPDHGTFQCGTSPALCGVAKAERTRKAKELLELVGMQERMTHRPDELSGGQKQRVAIARAMANDPSIILADERQELWTAKPDVLSWIFSINCMKNREKPSF